MRAYLDYQSACPLLPEVREAMLPFLSERFGSPSSLHQLGAAARQAISRAREQCAAFINAESPEEIIFTGSGSEAANLAVKGAALAQQRAGRHIVYSAGEQPAVVKSVEWLCENGFSATKVGLDSVGRLDLEGLGAAVRPDTTLICVHHASLDLGTIQPVPSIVRETTSARLFVDATASAGWTEVDVQKLQADLVALAPHRFYGPKGVGLLYRHRRARLSPLIHGGEQEGGKRAGTENVAGIVGAGEAAAIAGREWPRRESHTREMQCLFLSELRASVQHLKLNGPEPGPERLPNNLNVSFEFIEGEGLALMLDVRGVALASGAACVTKTMRVPPALSAIGLPESLARGNVIASFGQETARDEVQFAVRAVAKAVADLREMSPEWEDFKAGRVQSEV